MSTFICLHFARSGHELFVAVSSIQAFSAPPDSCSDTNVGANLQLVHRKEYVGVTENPSDIIRLIREVVPYAFPSVAP